MGRVILEENRNGDMVGEVRTGDSGLSLARLCRDHQDGDEAVFFGENWNLGKCGEAFLIIHSLSVNSGKSSKMTHI